MVPGLRLSPPPPSASRLPRTWRKLTASARKATRAGARGSPLAARNRSDSRRPGSRAAAVRGYPPARSRAGILLKRRSPGLSALRQRTEIKGRDLRSRAGAWESSEGSQRSRRNMEPLHPLVFMYGPRIRRRVDDGPLPPYNNTADSRAGVLSPAGPNKNGSPFAILVMGYRLTCPWKPQA